MSKDEYNPNDPAFLVSRDIDGDLSPSERARLKACLAGSEALPNEERALRAVAGLVDRWGKRVVDVDLAHHVKLVHADATGASNDPALQKADELLLRWASRSVDVDTEAFTAGVLSKLRSDERRLRPRRTVFRFGVPAAAAAVVMLAASAWLAFGPGEDARCYVDYDIPVMQPIGSGLAAQAVVSFAQPRDQAALTPRPALIGYMTLGSGPVAPPNWEDSFPL